MIIPGKLGRAICKIMSSSTFLISKLTQNILKGLNRKTLCHKNLRGNMEVDSSTLILTNIFLDLMSQLRQRSKNKLK